MSMTRRDYEDLALDLHTVLKHATPDTIQSRADTVWLVCMAITLTLKVKNPSFSEDQFFGNVFRGFEKHRPKSRLFPEESKNHDHLFGSPHSDEVCYADNDCRMTYGKFQDQRPAGR